jgi:hypothetical protein
MSLQAGPKGLYTLPGRRLDPMSRLYPGCALFFMLVIASIWVGTQYAARMFGYQSLLGRPIVGHVFEPFDIAL